MSSTLYFQPRQTGEKQLPDELKFVLRDGKYFGGLPRVVHNYDLSYFHALADANIKGAQKVIDAIEKYGEVELREEF